MTETINIIACSLEEAGVDIQKVRHKVYPLLRDIFQAFSDEKYTAVEKVVIVNSIISRMYDCVLENQTKEAAIAMRSYVEGGIELTMDSCERGHEILQ